MQTLSHSSKGCVLKMDDGRTITVQESSPVLIEPQEIATPTAPVVAEPVAVKPSKKKKV